MRSSYEIERLFGEKVEIHRYLINSDRETVDKANPYDLPKINYLNRLDTVVDIVKRHFRPSHKSRIGEFGCAQGIIALTLAELGYRVDAFDINPEFIEYAKLKHENGWVDWHVGDVNRLNFPKNSLDAAILGEVIEHCAYPEELVENVLKLVKPGGILIITTPNANRIRTSLPHFSKFPDPTSRKKLEKWQFGPDSSNHLFLFSLPEIPLIIPSNAKIAEQGYLGGTILINRHNLFLLRLFKKEKIPQIIKWFCEQGRISDLTCHNIYCVIRKQL